MKNKTKLSLVVIILMMQFTWERGYSKDTVEGALGEKVSLSLKECLSLILKTNTEYQSYIYKTKSRSKQIDEAKARLYYPDLSLSGGYQYQHTTPSSAIPTSPHTLTSSLDINYTIYSFGRDGAKLSIAEREYELSILEKESLKGRLLREVQEAYYRALLARQNIEIRKETSKLLKSTLLEERRNYLRGRSDKTGYIRINIQYTSDRLEEGKAEDEYIKALNNLLMLMSLEPVTRIDKYELKGLGFGEVVLEEDIVTERDFVMEKEALSYMSEIDGDLKELFNKAKERRIELKKLKIKQKILEHNKTVVSSLYKPSLSVYGSVGLRYTQQPELKAGGISLGDYDTQINYIAGVRLKIPLTELLLPNSSSHSKVKSLKYEIGALAKELSSATQKIEHEILLKHLEYKRYGKNLKDMKEISKLSQENFKIVRKAYRKGTLGYIKYLDAYVQYQKTQFGYYRELYNYNRSYLRLLEAIGIYY